MFLGVLFLLELIGLGYFYFADPLELFTEKTTSPIVEYDDSKDLPEYDHLLLNEAQENTLEKIGVNTANLPSTITPEMESCFVGALGQTRVNEIIAGDSPSAIDLFKAKSCLN